MDHSGCFFFPAGYFPDVIQAIQKAHDAGRVDHINGKTQPFQLPDGVFSIAICRCKNQIGLQANDLFQGWIAEAADARFLPRGPS